MNIRKTTLLFSLALALFVGGLSYAGSQQASAAYTNGSNLMDNRVFLNANSMGIAQIQSFLASKGSGLASRSFVLQCYGAGSQERQLYTSVGAPCDQNIPASHIIYYASRIYGVNPQVVLATLQKEQGLITTSNPTSWALNQAMGYGCPTTGNCSGNSTFSYQIDSGVWALRYHYERANGNNNWWSPSTSWVCGTEKNFYKPSLYPRQNVRFYDGNNVLYRTYYLANAATSAFYCYTPHAYNNPRAEFGRPAYGTVGQYYSGSYNFVNSFDEWFGSRFTPNCIFPAAVDNGVYRLYNKGTGNHLLTTDPAEVCAATSIGFMYDGVLFNQDPSSGVPIFRLERSGRYLYTSSTAERDSAVSGNGFRYEGVAFYGVNNSQNPSEARPVYRLTSQGGTYVYTLSSFERDALVSYGYVYQGVGFYLKENPGAAVTSVYRLSHPNGIYLFTNSVAERDNATYYGYRYEGVGFQAITQLNPITVPIYRLASNKGYVMTKNLLERIRASNLGYRDEGVGMFTYGTSDSTGLKNTYRLAGGSGTYLYTVSEAERDVAVNNFGYRLEGVGFLTP